MYKIIIKRITREQAVTKEYREIGKDDNGSAKYGYVDEESTKDVEREAYTQLVEDLDMAEVIKAVNGMNDVQMS